MSGGSRPRIVPVRGVLEELLERSLVGPQSPYSVPCSSSRRMRGGRRAADYWRGACSVAASPACSGAVEQIGAVAALWARARSDVTSGCHTIGRHDLRTALRAGGRDPAGRLRRSSRIALVGKRLAAAGHGAERRRHPGRLALLRGTGRRAAVQAAPRLVVHRRGQPSAPPVSCAVRGRPGGGCARARAGRAARPTSRSSICGTVADGQQIVVPAESFPARAAPAEHAVGSFGESADLAKRHDRAARRLPGSAR